MAEGQAGQPWTSQEVTAALDAYFRMLRWQFEERDFVKADVRAKVSEALPARSKKSIENSQPTLTRLSLTADTYSAWFQKVKLSASAHCSMMEMACTSWQEWQSIRNIRAENSATTSCRLLWVNSARSAHPKFIFCPTRG